MSACYVGVSPHPARGPALYTASSISSTKRRRTRGGASPAIHVAQPSDSTSGSLPLAAAAPPQRNRGELSGAAHPGLPGGCAAAACHWDGPINSEAASRPPQDIPHGFARAPAPVQLPIAGQQPAGAMIPTTAWPPHYDRVARTPHAPGPYGWGRPALAAYPYAFPLPGPGYPMAFLAQAGYAQSGFDPAAACGFEWGYPPPLQPFEWMRHAQPPPPAPGSAWGYPAGQAARVSPRRVNTSSGPAPRAATTCGGEDTVPITVPLPSSASSHPSACPAHGGAAYAAQAQSDPHRQERGRAPPHPTPGGDGGPAQPAPRSARDTLTLDDVRKLFGMSLSNAARECSMSAASFKRTCERLGIQRWPFRQLRALEQRIRRLKHQVSEHEERGGV